jgi:hypothetical protein
MDDAAEITLHPGDRVSALRDLDGDTDLQVPAGTEGTVAEDRGSTLVVAFDTDVQLCGLHERDLSPVQR